MSLTPRRDRSVALMAALVAALSVGCCAAAVVLRLGEPPVGADAVGPDLVLGTVWPVVGALVVRAAPRNPVGWVMLLASLLGPYQLCAWYAHEYGDAGVVGAITAWVATWGFVPYFFTLPVLTQIFPNGQVLTARWRPVLRTVVGVAAVVTLARMFAPVTTDLAPDVTNPLAVPPPMGDVLNIVTLSGSMALFFVGIPLGAVSLGLRARRAAGAERAQLQWLFLGAILLTAGILLPLGDPTLEGVGFSVGLAAVPVTIGIAMLRHRLFDVELTLNRTVVYAVLTAFVVAMYVAVVYVAQLLTLGSRWGVLLVVAAALTAAAARNRVQAVVDERLFGHRHNPYAVVTHVGRGVAAASQPIEALQSLVDGVAEALRLPYAAFVGTDIAVASGSPQHGSRVVPVTTLGEQVGELHVGLRSPREKWTPAQESAIQEVAARAGTLAYAARLVSDVARSRGRIVAAREEERRRLRADLHDGVAPALAGTALQLESLARRLDDVDPELARRALELRDGLRAGVGELRAVVHGLRPPVLDQLGLAGALRQLVAGHDHPRCTAAVDLSDGADAAVEVATYAIAAEAFGNALRHSVASRIELMATDQDGDIVVVVRDNGVGVPGRPRSGIGMVSMRERAAQVGGSLVISVTSGGGTTVTATLPREVA